MKKVIAVILCFFIAFSNAKSGSTSFYKSSTKSYSYSSARNPSSSRSGGSSLFNSPSKSNSNYYKNNNYKQNNYNVNSGGSSLFASPSKSNKNSTINTASNSNNGNRQGTQNFEQKIQQDLSNFENKFNKKPSTQPRPQSGTLFTAPSKSNVNSNVALTTAGVAVTTTAIASANNKVSNSNYNSSIAGQSYTEAINNKVNNDNLNSGNSSNVSLNLNKFENNSNLGYNTNSNNTTVNNYNGGNGNGLTNTLVNYMLISSVANSLSNHNKQPVVVDNYSNQQPQITGQEINKIIEPINESSNINPVKNIEPNPSDKTETKLNPQENNSSFPWYGLAVGIFTCIIVGLLIALFI